MLVNLSVVLGDATKAQKEFNQLREMAAKTPFSADGLASVATQLHAVGLESEQAMDMLTKFAAVAMGDNDKLQRMALNYAQIVSVGKASSIDMKQFAQMGLPVYQYMKEMQITGQATAEEVKKMFEMMTSEGGKFFGGIEKGAATANASLNAVRDNFSALSASIGDQFQPALKQLYGIASQLLAFATDNPLVTGAIVGVVSSLGVALAGSLVTGAMAGIKALKALAVQATVTGGVLSAMGKAIPIIGTLSAAIGVGVMAWSAISSAMKQAKEDAENQTLAIAEQNQQLREFLDLSDKIALRNAHRHDKAGNTTELEDILLLEDNLRNIEDEISAMDAGFKRLVESGYSLADATNIFNANNKEALDDLIARRNALIEEIQARKDAVEQQNEYLRNQERVTEELAKQAEYLKGAKEQYAKISEEIDSAYSLTDKGRMIALSAKIANYQRMLDNPVYATYTSNEYGVEHVNTMRYSPEQLEQIAELQASAQEQLDELTHKQKLYALEAGQEWKQTYLDAVGISNEELYERTGKYLSEVNSSFMIDTLLESVDSYEKEKEQLRKVFGDDWLVDIIMPERTVEERFEALTEKMNVMLELRKRLALENMYVGWDGTAESLNKEGTHGVYKLEKWIEDATAMLEVLSAQLQVTDEILEENKFRVFGDVDERFMNYGDYLQKSFRESGIGQMVSDSKDGELLSGISVDFVSRITEMFLSMDKVQKVLDPIGTILEGVFNIVEPLVDDALKPITDILTNIGQMLGTVIAPVITIVAMALRILSGVINIAIEPVRLFAELLKWINDSVIVPVGNALISIINGVINALNQIPFVSIPLVDNLEKMDVVISQFNNDAKDLTAQYEKLLNVMREQEQYYTSKKQLLVGRNATDKIMGVNDMILTPHGNFSTHPDDYLIATKKPESLGSATVNVQINNTVSDSVDASVEQVVDERGINKLMVTISRKIADDVARGANGWDSAFGSRGRRLIGRSWS